jgi:hypothetical protein
LKSVTLLDDYYWKGEKDKKKQKEKRPQAYLFLFLSPFDSPA